MNVECFNSLFLRRPLAKGRLLWGRQVFLLLFFPSLARDELIIRVVVMDVTRIPKPFVLQL